MTDLDKVVDAIYARMNDRLMLDSGYLPKSLDRYREYAADLAQVAIDVMGGWKPIETHKSDAIKGPFSPHVLCGHKDKKWIRMGRYDLSLKRWYYSGTNERSQWAQVEGDEPTHWMPLPPAPKEEA